MGFPSSLHDAGDTGGPSGSGFYTSPPPPPAQQQQQLQPQTLEDLVRQQQQHSNPQQQQQQLQVIENSRSAVLASLKRIGECSVQQQQQHPIAINPR